MSVNRINTKEYEIECDTNQTLAFTIESKGPFSGRIYLTIDEAEQLHYHLGELIELAKKESTHDAA